MTDVEIALKLQSLENENKDLKNESSYYFLELKKMEKRSKARFYLLLTVSILTIIFISIFNNHSVNDYDNNITQEKIKVLQYRVDSLSSYIVCPECVSKADNIN